MAQLVEARTANREEVGSIPTQGNQILKTGITLPRSTKDVTWSTETNFINKSSNINTRKKTRDGQRMGLEEEGRQKTHHRKKTLKMAPG